MTPAGSTLGLLRLVVHLVHQHPHSMASGVPHVRARNQLLRKIRRNETAAHMNGWLASPENPSPIFATVVVLCVFMEV